MIKLIMGAISKQSDLRVAILVFTLYDSVSALLCTLSLGARNRKPVEQRTLRRTFCTYSNLTGPVKEYALNNDI